MSPGLILTFQIFVENEPQKENTNDEVFRIVLTRLKKIIMLLILLYRVDLIFIDFFNAQIRMHVSTNISRL